MLLSNLGDTAPSLPVTSEGYLGTWPPRNISQPPPQLAVLSVTRGHAAEPGPLWGPSGAPVITATEGKGVLATFMPSLSLEAGLEILQDDQKQS